LNRGQRIGVAAYFSGFGAFEFCLNCNSSDNTIRWQHVLNAMLGDATDGNAYILACDRAWRWSKCTGLKPGDTL
jgi:hypothetical protein